VIFAQPKNNQDGLIQGPTEPANAVPTMTQPIKFSLAANYDPELVPALAAYPVDEVYGKLPGDGVSGGRPRYLARPLSEDDLRRYVRLLDQYGIAFNYLLNGSCFGNREWTSSWQKKVTALLAKLGDMGVRRVTVSTPFLLELVKRRFPEFKAKVGIYAQVDTPRRAGSLPERGTRRWNCFRRTCSHTNLPNRMIAPWPPCASIILAMPRSSR